MTKNKPFVKRFIFREEFWYLLLTIYFYFSNLIFVYRKASGLLNSDSSGEMILAAHLNKVGGFLSKEWCYSSELRVLNTQIVYKFSLLFFPNNWHMARVMSIGIFMLILIAVGWYFMWAAGVKKKGLLFSAILICPLGQWYAWNVIYNSFYVPHIAISLLSIALLLHVLKTKKKIAGIILTACLLILAFGAGLGGIRQILVCYAPLLLTCFILFLVNVKEKEKWKMLFLSVGVFVCGTAGYLINARILSGIYIFEDYNETIWNDFTLPVIWTALEQLIRLFGWEPNTKVISLSGIGNFVCIAIVLGMIICFVICFKKIKSLKDEQRIPIVFSLSGFLFLLLVFAETWVYNESYWIPAVPFFFIPVLFVLDYEIPKKRKEILIAALALGLIICGGSAFKNYRIGGVPNDETIHNVSTWLKNQDEYKQGIAMFWNAPVVTEKTDGKIEMWTVEDYTALQPCEWLQVKSHMTLPKGKVFVLIPDVMANDGTERCEALKKYIIYDDGNYIVYGFNHYTEYFTVE